MRSDEPRGGRRDWSREGRCDYGFWDPSGELTTETRRRLSDRIKLRGERVETVVGELGGQRIAIATPVRAIAARLADAAEGLLALFTAHRPTHLVAIGPAAAVDASCDVGVSFLADAVVCHNSARVANAEELAARSAPAHVAVGPVGDGVFVARHDAEPALTTDWAAETLRAATREGLAVDLLAVATRGAAAPGRKVRPPSSRRTTRSREVGRAVGALLAGRAPPVAERDPVIDRAAASAIEALLSARDG